MIKSKFTEEDLTLLFSISHKITAVRDKKDLLKVIESDLKQLIPYNDVSICRIVDDHMIKPLIYQFSEPRRNNPLYDVFMEAAVDIETNQNIKDIMESDDPIVLDLTSEIAKEKVRGPYLTFFLETGIKEQVGISLIDGTKAFGKIVLYMEKRNTLTRKNLQMFKTIARQFSPAIGNIISNDEILKREQEKTLLLDLNIDIASISTKDALQEVVSNRLRDLLDFDYISICILSRNGDTSSPWYCHITEQFLDNKYVDIFSIPDYVYDLVFSSDQPVIMELGEILKHPSPPYYVNLWYSLGIREVVAATMKIGDKNSGIFFIMNKIVGQFDRKNLFLFKGITSQISIAISHLTATEEIARREYEKSVLLDLNYEFASIRDREGLSALVAGSLSKLFSFDYLSICVLDKMDKSYALFTCQLAEKHADDPVVKNMKNRFPLPDIIYDSVFTSGGPVIIKLDDIINRDDVPKYIQFAYSMGARELVGIALDDGVEKNGILIINNKKVGQFNLRHIDLLKGIVYQVAMSVSNIIANEKIGLQLSEINRYKSQLEDEKLYLQEEIKTTYNYNEIIGRSSSMQKIFNLVSLVAYTDSTVLLLGETGTGKELIARAIHNSSPRQNKVMMKVNCAAIPANLIESELFGHEKGSFTGAEERRIGKFELANNSTIFLDEIGELTLELQAKLLRVLQEKEIERLGGKETIKVDIRVIAATNRNLLKETEAGRFRSDLYYRLNVFPIILPSLRERKEDIPILTSHFISKFARSTGKNIKNISHVVMQQMIAYQWPGNVRELEHLIERSVLLTSGPTITEVHLPVIDQGGSAVKLEDFRIKSIPDLEKEHIISVLKKCNGRVSGPKGAAVMLNIPASTLFSKMEKMGIQKNFGFDSNSK
jgi:formate hydrogenlyase transcriptional activator